MHAIDTEAVAAGVDQLITLLPRVAPAKDLSLVAAAVLATLDREGPMRITDLAERQAVSQPGMTGLVARLHRQRLLDRAPDPNDRRSVRVSITSQGAAVLAERRRTRAATLARLIGELDAADQAALAAAVPAISGLVARSLATGIHPAGAPA